MHYNRGILAKIDKSMHFYLHISIIFCNFVVDSDWFGHRLTLILIKYLI